MTRRNRRLIVIALLIPILVYAFAGRYSRLMADDFCYAVNARANGFPSVILYYYDNWFGRITQIVGATAGTTLGVGFAAVFPAILLALWLIGLLWLCRELVALLKWDQPAAVYSGAALILYATLAGTPQIFHSLYWISAVFPYTVPLVLATYTAALVLRGLRLGSASPLAILACIALTLVAEFSSEPFAVAFVGALAAGIVGVVILRPSAEGRRAVLTLLIAALITALVALAIMVAAPGNSLREGLFTPTHAPLQLISQSLIYGAATLIATIWFSPPAILLALVLPAVIAYGQPATGITPRRLRIGMALTALIAFGLIVLTTVPAIYATSTAPPARALIIPQFVLICAGVVIGALAGLSARKSVRRVPPLIFAGLIGVLLLVGPLLTAGQMIALTPKLNTYAAEWDQRDEQLRAVQGQQAVKVAPLTVDVATLTGLDTINADATSFTNACAASYYGVKSITATG